MAFGIFLGSNLKIFLEPGRTPPHSSAEKSQESRWTSGRKGEKVKRKSEKRRIIQSQEKRIENILKAKNTSNVFQ